MQKELIVIHDPLTPASWRRIKCESVLAALQTEFDVFPENARLYNGNVSASNDITPRSEEEIDALNDLPGPFYCVNYPQGITTLVIIAVIAVLAVVAIAVLAKPRIPTSTNRNVDSESPNNALSGRTNGIRVNGRIPDIFGQVRSTPDLIAVPYSIFEANQEVEYTYMCIGRGTYQILADDVRDGTTPVSQIPGETVEIFGPNTSPNAPGAGPQLRIGDAISRRVISALRSKSVNGQTLLAPNEGAFNSASDVFNFNAAGFIYSNTYKFSNDFTAGGQIVVTASDGQYPLGPDNTNNEDGIGRVAFSDDTTFTNYMADLSVRFYADGRMEFQSVTNIGTVRKMNNDGVGYCKLTHATVTDGVNTAVLDGKYIVRNFSNTTIKAENPTNSTAQWSNLSAFSGGVSPYVTATFYFPVNSAVNLSGTYTVDHTTNDVPSPGGHQLFVTMPAASRINNDWIWLQYIYRSQVENVHAFMAASVGTGWIGPFVLDSATANEFLLNFVSPNGSYKDDGTHQTPSNVAIEIGYVPCTAAGVPTGVEAFVSTTVTGSSSERGTIGLTKVIAGFAGGRYAVRARRVTPKDLLFNGQISDEVKWRDLYASSPVADVAFGDITTVHCRTKATKEALAISERQINMLVIRKIPLRTSGSTFGTTLTATKSADEIISFICLDPKIGNRAKSEVNFDKIYAAIADVKSYFGLTAAGEFSYTFDSDNLSFEETLQVVANAVFCTAHRRYGSVIEISFEKATNDSVILFNHRNKVPGSEQRSITFGNLDDNDGIEYEYISPVDDGVTTIYIPPDRSAVKPRKIQSVGVRSYESAYLHAYREYNRLRYQNVAVEFEATEEADVVLTKARVLVADNTRPDTQDGEITSQDGLLLGLSQPAILKTGVTYFASLQLASGLVQNIPCIDGGDPYHIVLSTAPNEALVLNDDANVKTLYQIVRTDDGAKAACLVVEKDYASNFTCKMSCINYDARYYTNDLDFHA